MRGDARAECGMENGPPRIDPAPAWFSHCRQRTRVRGGRGGALPSAMCVTWVSSAVP